MKSRKAVIALWRKNRSDAFRRGMFSEVERINKILRLHGNLPEQKKHNRW